MSQSFREFALERLDYFSEDIDSIIYSKSKRIDELCTEVEQLKNVRSCINKTIGEIEEYKEEGDEPEL